MNLDRFTAGDRKVSISGSLRWGKDKVTVLVESYRFNGIKLPFLFHKVTVFGPKLPFFVGPNLPFILG